MTLVAEVAYMKSFLQCTLYLLRYETGSDSTHCNNISFVINVVLLYATVELLEMGTFSASCSLPFVSSSRIFIKAAAAA